MKQTLTDYYSPKSQPPKKTIVPSKMALFHREQLDDYII